MPYPLHAKPSWVSSENLVIWSFGHFQKMKPCNLGYRIIYKYILYYRGFDTLFFRILTKWPNDQMTILAYLNNLNIVKKKHTNICRKTFANIRKIYYLCISKYHQAPHPRHLRWLTLKPLTLATFGGLPLPLWRGVNGLGYWKPHHAPPSVACPSP